MKLTLKETIIGAAIVVALSSLFYWDSHRFTTPVITHPTTNTTVVEVPKITERVVTQFIQDPAQAKLVTDLLAENKRLKLEVSGLTSTVAKLESKGGLNVNGGTITLLPQTTMGVQGVSPTLSVDSYLFKDFQLSANYTSNGKSFDYTLAQLFVITTTTGKDVNGHTTQLVKLNQKVNESMVEVPTTTIELQAPSNPNRFYLSPRIQGGLALGFNGKSPIVAIQWLRRGTSPAAEDTTFSFLSPALTTGGLTLLPVSVNLGRIKHNPFTNIWVSPTVDLKQSIGLAVTATF